MNKPASLETQTDEQLLRLGRGGDEDAFLTLYHRHQARVSRFALHMSGTLEIAEEVVQEIFLALLADDLRYSEDRGTLEAFLIGMARNQVRRQLREARKIDPIQDAVLPEPPFESIAPEDELEALRKSILTLPESYRAVIVLCDLQEISYADAAERLGCAIGTVRSRLHRARAILELKLRRRERCRVTTAG